ncbi:hypothetical protein JYU10_00285 [bacterium AH-315-J04]|nr:hypothetical protein [bacterium AH-315-J04]
MSAGLRRAALTSRKISMPFRNRFHGPWKISLSYFSGAVVNVSLGIVSFTGVNPASIIACQIALASGKVSGEKNMDTSPVFKSTWTLATFLTRSTERRMPKAQPSHVMPRTSIDASALTLLWAWVGIG